MCNFRIYKVMRQQKSTFFSALLIFLLFPGVLSAKENVTVSGRGVDNPGSSVWYSPLDPGFVQVTERDNLDYSGVMVIHGKKIPIKGNVAQLKYFFDALNAAKSKKVRVAHWGDSIILGDIITEGIRENLQKQYGGNGVGFVSINCDDYGMRNSTVVSFSNDWKEGSAFKRNADKMPLGVNASVYTPVPGSWVKYELGKVSRTVRSLVNARLFYASAPAGAVLKYSANNGPEQSAKLEGGAGLKELDISLSSGTTSIRFNFGFGGGFFYGVSFENGNGVYVDNLPIRGNTGVALADLPLNLLKEFNQKMNYRLLLINFGVNVVSPEHTNYMWYEQRMEKVINHLKEAFPQASILIISIGDKAIKKGTRFITDPGIPGLLKAQQSIAEKNGIAFWNLFEAMGGENSVVDWVDASPQLSAKDYCHLTTTGGRLVADLFCESLLKEKKQ